MKNMFAVVITIAVMFAITFAIADVEQLGGYNDEGFVEFVKNAYITDPVYYGGKAYQKIIFDTGWHINSECSYDGSYDNTEYMTIDVYDETGCVVGDKYIVSNDDTGEQHFWDLMYNIYKRAC